MDQGIKNLQIQLNQEGANLKVDGIWGQNTQMAYLHSIANKSSDIKKNNTISSGMPFSEEDQAKAYKDAMNVLDPYYIARQQYDMANTSDILKQKQAGYNNFLRTSSNNFIDRKNTLDENAANRGVLFSGGRVQKEKDLANNFSSNQALKKSAYGSDISNTLRGFQYKYGNNSLGGLSNYYKLGGNTYNPNVARNEVNSSGLSSIYNPNSYNFQGTVNNEKKAYAQERAAAKLKNMANRIVPFGYKNKLY